MSFSTSTSTNATGQELANDVTVANPPTDTVLQLSFCPTQDLLAASSWDNKVRVYAIDPSLGQNEGRALYDHEAPTLLVHWTGDGSKVVSGGLDGKVMLFDLASQQAQQIGAHDAPVLVVKYVECGPSNTPAVVSGLWDKSLRYWDMRLPLPMSTVVLPERVYCMDTQQKLLVAALAGRSIAVVDLNAPQQIFKTVTLPLKWPTRLIACYPQANGYAIGLIEGRCAFQYIDDAEQTKLGFTFRCHRKTPGGVGPNRADPIAYAVDSMAFHPVYGTLSTTGADGTFCFWDKDARQRLKAFPDVGYPIPASAFNRSGSIFAYALGYDWSEGVAGNRPDYPNMIKLHATNESEVAPKKKR